MNMINNEPSRGFFTIAQGEHYQRLAYGLALSLKISQPQFSNLSIGVTRLEKKKIKQKYKEIFHEIIDIPWSDDAKKSKWKLENEWKSIHMSPYDYTIKLDGDMLFFTDITSWWNILEKSDILFASDVLTYRNEKITSDYYRKTFTENNLPNMYSAFFFFKKTDLSFEFFKLSQIIFHNWQKFFEEHLLPLHRPSYLSTDVIFAIANKILGINELNNCPVNGVPTFVHMKTKLQHWDGSEQFDENWMNYVPIYYTPDHICKIGTYRQIYPLHYFIKDFLNDDMITKMEKKLGI